MENNFVRHVIYGWKNLIVNIIICIISVYLGIYLGSLLLDVLEKNIAINIMLSIWIRFFLSKIYVDIKTDNLIENIGKIKTQGKSFLGLPETDNFAFWYESIISFGLIFILNYILFVG